MYKYTRRYQNPGVWNHGFAKQGYDMKTRTAQDFITRAMQEQYNN